MLEKSITIGILGAGGKTEMGKGGFMIKINNLILGIVLVVLTASCSGVEKDTGDKVSAQGTIYEWKMQSSENAGTIMHQKEQEWAKDVDRMSNGRIKIDILPPASVVPMINVLDATESGILQMYSADPSFFAGKNPAFAMMGNLVGAWDDPWLAYDFMKFNGGEELYNKILEPYGAHLIGATFLGVESLVSKRPVDGIESFKGLKIRAPQGLVSDVMSKLGAAPVNLPGSEVFTALQKGTIDAADYNSFAVNYQSGLYDIGKYTNYPGIHSLPMHSISINKKIWDGLPDDIKSMLEMSIYKLNFELIESIKLNNDKAIIEAKSSGADIVISEWSAEEKAKFRSIVKDAWAEWAAQNELTQEYYDLVLKYMKSRGLISE